MIEIKTLEPDQWALFKQIRCQALADAPYAFSSTLAAALKRTDAEWADLVQRRATDPNDHTFLAYVADQLCGMATCICRTTAGETPTAEMFAVWVDPNYRKHKVGTALVEHARHWSKARGAATLYVGVFAANQIALRFYQAIGFTDQGKRGAEPEIFLLEMSLA